LNGTWKNDRNENYDKFMEQMGINMVKRKLAEHDNLKLIIEQNGDKFTIKESSNFRTKDVEFTLGVQFEYTMADGTDLTVRTKICMCVVLQGTWVMEGETLKGTFNRKDNGKILTTTRSVVGGELVQCYNYEGVDAKRIFKK
ncbi:fatty acid-binding protein, intestinal, partial [Silurus meridionalis]